MKKKYITALFVCFLLLCFSIPTFAIGNSYSFTSTWFQAVVNSSVINFNGSDISLNPSTVGFLSLDGENYNADNTYSNRFVYSINRLRQNFDLYIPLNLNVNGSDSLNLSFAYSSGAWSGDISFEFITDKGNLTPTYTITEYNLVESGTAVFSDTNDFDPDFSGKGAFVNIDWRFGSSLNITSLVIHFTDFTFGSSDTFMIGFTASNNTVVLPDDVLDNLIYISENVRLVANRIVTLINEVRSLNSLITELANKIAENASSSGGYYQQVISGTPASQTAVDRMKSVVSFAQQQLAGLSNIIQSVKVPKANALISSTQSATTKTNINTALGNSDIQDIFDTLYGFGAVMSMLLITVSIGTFGFVIFGKAK